VIVLDENIFESQRVELLARKFHLCQVGHDIGRKGMQDNEIVVLLRQVRRPKFFTRDKHFFKKSLCSDAYCLVQLDVRPLEVAEFARRFLRHTEFKAWSQRQGSVARVSRNGVSVWRIGAPRIVRYRWSNA
jgi:hypothetical protein